MSTEHETQREIRRILRLLEATARVVESSQIIDPDEGHERCALQFNNVLSHLTELGAAPEGLFEPLESSASFGEISFACHQVAAYLKEGLCDEFDFAHVKKTIGDELKDVGEVVRQSMPAFLKDVWSGGTEETPPETVEVTSDEDEDGEETDSVAQRVARLEGQMETVVEILQKLRAQQVERDEE